jgi:signal peptidase II
MAPSTSSALEIVGRWALNKRVLFWALFLGLLLLDQAVKFWARGAADGVEGRTFYPLWPGVFELTLVYNKGIAFGQLQGYGVLLTPIALLIAGGSIWYSMKHPQASRVYHVVAALFAAGALGNLFDRLYLGKVTDMFDFRLIGFPVFNVADACITVSGAVMVILWIREAFEERKQAKQPDAGSAEVL